MFCYVLRFRVNAGFNFRASFVKTKLLSACVYGMAQTHHKISDYISILKIKYSQTTIIFVFSDEKDVL